MGIVSKNTTKINGSEKVSLFVSHHTLLTSECMFHAQHWKTFPANWPQLSSWKIRSSGAFHKERDRISGDDLRFPNVLLSLRPTLSEASCIPITPQVHFSQPGQQAGPSCRCIGGPARWKNRYSGSIHENKLAKLKNSLVRNLRYTTLHRAVNKISRGYLDTNIWIQIPDTC